jgi:O-antigen biosynthesis protein WbqV
MRRDALLAGAAPDVGAALSSFETWAPPGLNVRGVVVIGDGAADHAVVTHARSWDRIDFGSLPAKHVIMTTPMADRPEARALLRRAADAHAVLSLIEEGALRRLRLDDLVGRPLGAVDWSRIGAMIEGKRVLITGGGGTIGGELARRVASLDPARLTLLDASEANLYRMGLELRFATPVLADIRDAASMRRWFAREQPDIVFHAAALKQVPMVEAFASEGVLTNIVGLRNVAEAAHGVNADLFFVSTDKAVDPSGVMGASKRLGELYCQALDRRGARRAAPVRLGNVLGSTGSVAPVFEEQLANGGPLTVTHPEVTRFFLSIPQAADALLQAAAVSLASEHARGAVLTIDMGEALPVVELARDVIRLEGRRPDSDVPIVYTGLRPGEKLHEALIAADEWRERDPAPGVMAAASEPRSLGELHEVMDRLALLARQGADEAIVAELFDAIAAPVEEERAIAV